MKLVNKKDILNILKINSSLLKSKNVSIFVHESPDFDAISSALALKDYFLSKKINAKIIGLEFAEKSVLDKIYEKVTIDKYNDEFIKNSSAIVVDTANKARILTGKHLLAKKVFRIDHHPKIETIGETEWVDEKMSSTSEMVGWYIMINENKISKRQANFLYTGILADTGRLMYRSTTETTLLLLAKFFEVGFNKQEIQDLMFAKNLSSIKLDNEITSKIKIKNKIGILIIDKNLTKKIIKNNESLAKVYLMNDIEGLKAWMCAYFDEESNRWKISLRSKKYNVRLFAQKFNGGGHAVAAGIKAKSFSEVESIVNKLVKYKLIKV